MSNTARNVEFQEIWTNLKKTVVCLLELEEIESAEMNARFDDVHALCVAHPPFDSRLYDETKWDAQEDVDEKLAGAIVVSKYVDDKEAFEKCYTRDFAKRLLHQLSASMEQEEAMINRLKPACSFGFTYKLNRMFTDVAESADLNSNFQRYLQDNSLASTAGFSVQVLQTAAWPFDDAMAALAPPPQLERPLRQFETFYRASFSDRRLVWLNDLSTGELRTHFTQRVYHINATMSQCALLLCFENVDTAPARELRKTIRLSGEAWVRHLRPLIDAGLLIAKGDVDADEADGTLRLNLEFTSKSTEVRLSCANATSHQVGGSGSKAKSANSDDDCKMYLEAALVRIMKQHRVLRHSELIREVVSQGRLSFPPTRAMIKTCIEKLIDMQYLARMPEQFDTYSYIA